MKVFNTLTASEKRTIRLAAMVLGGFLAAFVAYNILLFFQHRRAAYLNIAAEAQQLKRDAKDYPNKAAMVKKLMDDFQLDPARLVKSSVMAEASAAIQKAANGGGVKPGAIRESPGHASKKELGTIQFEGSGQVAAVMALLHRLPLLGYPLVIDSVQITSDPMRPDQIKLNVTINVLDFEQWKKTEAPHA